MAGKPLKLSRPIRMKLREARIAHLATSDARGRPHVVPVCFAFDGKTFFTAIDQKPKRVMHQQLARVRNIEATPAVALVIDHYQEDWTRLWFVLVRGQAKLMPRSAGRERMKAIRMLRKKYPQYAAGMLRDEAPVIRITPKRVTSWGKL